MYGEMISLTVSWEGLFRSFFKSVMDLNVFIVVFLLKGTKKPAGWTGARWVRDGSVRGGQRGCLESGRVPVRQMPIAISVRIFVIVISWNRGSKFPVHPEILIYTF
jgi:hypothetical protein